MDIDNIDFDFSFSNSNTYLVTFAAISGCINLYHFCKCIRNKNTRKNKRNNEMSVELTETLGDNNYDNTTETGIQTLDKKTENEETQTEDNQFYSMMGKAFDYDLKNYVEKNHDERRLNYIV